MVTGAKVRPIADEEEQLRGKLLGLQGEQHVGVRDRLAELEHGPSVIFQSRLQRRWRKSATYPATLPRNPVKVDCSIPQFAKVGSCALQVGDEKSAAAADINRIGNP